MAEVIIGEVISVDTKQAKNGSFYTIFILEESWGYRELKKSIRYNCSTFDLSLDIRAKDKIVVFGFVINKVVQGTTYKNFEVINIMNQQSFTRPSQDKP